MGLAINANKFSIMGSCLFCFLVESNWSNFEYRIFHSKYLIRINRTWGWYTPIHVRGSIFSLLFAGWKRVFIGGWSHLRKFCRCLHQCLWDNEQSSQVVYYWQPQLSQKHVWISYWCYNSGSKCEACTAEKFTIFFQSFNEGYVVMFNVFIQSRTYAIFAYSIWNFCHDRNIKHIFKVL